MSNRGSGLLIRSCMFYAYTRPRYQVSVYRPIGPLLLLLSLLLLLFANHVAKCDLVHVVEIIHCLCLPLTAFVCYVA